MSDWDIAIVGGGILGLATARELLLRRPGLRLVVLERETEIARGQTGSNSGVIHAGVYYAPGSLKARLCLDGAREMYEFCNAKGIPAERCGKVIVASNRRELPALLELERRGRANGVAGLRRIGPDELRELEPHARGVAALRSPNTGVVDFAAVARAYAADVEAAGGVVLRGVEVIHTVRPPGSDGNQVRLLHRRGVVRAGRAIFCTGHSADRMAVEDGADPDPRIVPFRGTYLRLKAGREELVRSLIYPVPDAHLPFLGVHLTRHPQGGVLIGPSALLEPRLHSLVWPGTWRLMRRYWRAGLTELGHGLSQRRMVAAARRFVPELSVDDVEPAWAGVRAQALGRDGTLLDDFAFSEAGASLHVRNAPSPAATSSLAIARLVADRVWQDRG